MVDVVVVVCVCVCGRKRQWWAVWREMEGRAHRPTRNRIPPLKTATDISKVQDEPRRKDMTKTETKVNSDLEKPRAAQPGLEKPRATQPHLEKSQVIQPALPRSHRLAPWLLWLLGEPASASPPFLETSNSSTAPQ